jgi:hypothetical protein
MTATQAREMEDEANPQPRPKEQDCTPPHLRPVLIGPGGRHGQRSTRAVLQVVKELIFEVASGGSLQDAVRR